MFSCCRDFRISISRSKSRMCSAVLCWSFFTATTSPVLSWSGSYRHISTLPKFPCKWRPTYLLFFFFLNTWFNFTSYLISYCESAHSAVHTFSASPSKLKDIAQLFSSTAAENFWRIKNGVEARSCAMCFMCLCVLTSATISNLVNGWQTASYTIT